jgi:hypothetical protein
LGTLPKNFNSPKLLKLFYDCSGEILSLKNGNFKDETPQKPKIFCEKWMFLGRLLKSYYYRYCHNNFSQEPQPKIQKTIKAATSLLLANKKDLSTNKNDQPIEKISDLVLSKEGS